MRLIQRLSYLLIVMHCCSVSANDLNERVNALHTQLKSLKQKFQELSQGLDSIRRNLLGEPEELLPYAYEHLFHEVSMRNTDFLAALNEDDAMLVPHCQTFRQAVVQMKMIPRTKLGAQQLVEAIVTACNALTGALSVKYKIDDLGIATITEYASFKTWLKKDAKDLNKKVIPLAAALREFIKDGQETDDEFVKTIAGHLNDDDKQAALVYLLFSNQYLGYNFLSWAAHQAFYFAHKPDQDKLAPNVIAHLLKIISSEDIDFVKAIESVCSPSKYSEAEIINLPKQIQLDAKNEPEVSWAGAAYTDQGRALRAEIICAIHARSLMDNVKNFEKELLKEKILQEQGERKRKIEVDLPEADKKKVEENEQVARVIEEIKLDTTTKLPKKEVKKDLSSLLDIIKRIASIESSKDILKGAEDNEHFNFIGYLDELLNNLTPEMLRVDERLRELLGYTDTILANILKSTATLQNMAVRLTEHEDLYAIAQLIRLILRIPNDLIVKPEGQSRLTFDSIAPVADSLYAAIGSKATETNILTHYFAVIARKPNSLEEASDFLKTYFDKVSMGPKRTVILKLDIEVKKQKSA